MRRPGARARSAAKAARQQAHTASLTRRGALISSREARDGIAKAVPTRALYLGSEEFVSRVRGL